MLKNGPVPRLGFPFILPGLLSAALALATVLQSPAPGESAGKERASRKAGIIMAQTQAASAQNVGQPPLDLAVPAQIATATFALG